MNSGTLLAHQVELEDVGLPSSFLRVRGLKERLCTLTIRAVRFTEDCDVVHGDGVLDLGLYGDRGELGGFNWRRGGSFSLDRQELDIEGQDRVGRNYGGVAGRAVAQLGLNRQNALFTDTPIAIS